MNYDIKILPNTTNKIYAQRETGLVHSPFIYELQVFNSIKNGNTKELKKALDNYLTNGFVIGNMSDNNITEMRYWAVSTISIAIHYAILGGLDETDAYNLSDEYICTIDKIKSFEECINYLIKKSYELTIMVESTKSYSAIIKKSIHYININLHKKITIDELASNSNISKDYLSVLFKKETKESIHSYIISKKLEEAIKLIEDGMSFNDISYTLAFCSQTHFITAFKKKYGLTPLEYKKAYYTN